MEGGNILFDLNNLELNPRDGLKVKNQEVPLAKVDQFVFSTGSRKGTTAPLSRLAWYDGAIISGELEAIDHDSVKVNPTWLEKRIHRRVKERQKALFPGIKRTGDVSGGCYQIGQPLTGRSLDSRESWCIAYLAFLAADWF